MDLSENLEDSSELRSPVGSPRAQGLEIQFEFFPASTLFAVPKQMSSPRRCWPSQDVLDNISDGDSPWLSCEEEEEEDEEEEERVGGKFITEKREGQVKQEEDRRDIRELDESMFDGFDFKNLSSKQDMLAHLRRIQSEISLLARTRNASILPTSHDLLYAETCSPSFSPLSTADTLFESFNDAGAIQFSSANVLEMRKAELPTVSVALRSFCTSGYELVRVIVERHPTILIMCAVLAAAIYLKSR